MPSPKRIFDVDFPSVSLAVNRPEGVVIPDAVTWGGVGADQLIGADDYGNAIFYHQIDLSQLTNEMRAFTPLSVNVQRAYNAPEGLDANYMPSTPAYEMLYVFQNPLDNFAIRDNPRANMEAFRDMGLDVSSDGVGMAVPDSSNCIFAQMTRYRNDLSNSTTVYNGMAVPGDTYYPLVSQDMSIAEINTWGGMETILGPRLHCYRVIFHETQNLLHLDADPVTGNPLVLALGTTLRTFSPISIRLFCQEADLDDGDYLIEAANAFNRWNWDATNRR